MDDSELLREYARCNSEEAFATLVSRYIDMVYSAAFRHVANHHQAEEITQAVFVVLARKAAALSPATVLAGWLFRTTRLTCANYVRAEIRRTRREQEAAMQSNPEEHPPDGWRAVEPMLDEAIAGLRERDRNAIVLRFLHGRQYKAVAAALGGTEEAAQMRVSRALEKLRKHFAKRGVVLTATALGGLITAHATHAAPLGLAGAVTVGALQGTTLTASTLTLVKGTLKFTAWTKLNFAVGVGVAMLLAYQSHQNSVLVTHVAAARGELRAARATASTQESRIAELEEQATAIIGTQHEQEQALARLRPRRALGAYGTQPGSAAVHTPATLVSAMLSNPAARDSLREQLIGDARKRWGQVVKQLKLKPEDAQKLYEMFGDVAMKEVEAVAAFTESRITAEAAVQAGAQAEQDAANQARLLVGEETFASLQEARRSLPAQSLGEQFDRQLGFFAIKSEQRERLRALFASVPDGVAQDLAGEFTVRQLVYPDELDRRFAEEKQADQQILEQAAAFLEPNNVDALALMQEYNLAAHQRTALQILRKL